MRTIFSIIGIGHRFYPIAYHCYYFAIIAMFYKKVPQGQALVSTGFGGTKVATDRGMYVVPVFHRVEIMDISVKENSN